MRIVEDLTSLKIVIWMKMGIEKHKFDIQVVIDLMIIGENRGKNGYHMMSTKRQGKKSISMKIEVFTKKRNRYMKRNQIWKTCLQDS